MAESLRDDSGIHIGIDYCEICGAVINLKVCARCRRVAYCSKEHQKCGWQTHKLLCQRTSTTDPKTTPMLGPMPMGAVTHQLETLSIIKKDVMVDVTSTSSGCVDQQNAHIDHDGFGESHIGASNICIDANPEVAHSTSYVGNSRNQDKIPQSVPMCIVNLPEDKCESGGSENFILESEKSVLHAPKYTSELNFQNITKEPVVSVKMPHLSVLESRNKALSEYVIKCLNAYGVCVIDNFLGDSKGSEILDEVTELYESGELSSGQLVNAASPKVAVRGDLITWVDGSECGCNNINFLISSIDAIMLHCQQSLGKYNIKGRSKAMVAVFPGHATGFLRHVDNPGGDGRCVTCIYYLNKNWNSKIDGGLLRIFPEGENRVANVEPKFDRLVFFWSDRRNPHEVQPSFRTRFAVTVWFYDEMERQKAVKMVKAGKECTDIKFKDSIPLSADGVDSDSKY